MAKLSSLKTDIKLGSPNKVAEVRDFLSKHYEILINRFDPNPNRAIIRPKTKKFDYSVTWNEISIHMIEEGIQCSDTLLKKLLRSPNYMKTYNPISDYFDSLKGKWKGVSHIDLLASHFTCRDYHDMGRDYYQIRWYKFLKKWLVAVVACALGKRANDVALGLVHHDEGIGKTFFFKFLMPEVLKYYLVITKDDPNKFDMETAFVQNMVVLFEELVGLNKRNNEVFKKVMSEDEIQITLPRDPFPQNMPRIGSGCFTTNQTPDKGGFLTQGMSYRRMLIIELESINQEYSKKVDVDQIWAEALTLMEQDYNYTWDMEDWNEFKVVNERYRVETSGTKYIRMYFRKPGDEEGEWMQAQQVLQFLVDKKLIRSEDRGSLSNEAIGRALTQLGYERKKVRVGKDSVYAYNLCHLDSL